jgi:hypothetical protein
MRSDENGSKIGKYYELLKAGVDAVRAVVSAYNSPQQIQQAFIDGQPISGYEQVVENPSKELQTISKHYQSEINQQAKDQNENVEVFKDLEDIKNERLASERENLKQAVSSEQNTAAELRNGAEPPANSPANDNNAPDHDNNPGGNSPVSPQAAAPENTNDNVNAVSNAEVDNSAAPPNENVADQPANDNTEEENRSKILDNYQEESRNSNEAVNDDPQQSEAASQTTDNDYNNQEERRYR